ncbi:MAG: gamma-glutamyl-gamma-aminobutyrate hydrolase family protein [Tannerella sp.]|nr:gamma-glutamyl-gamma-aminobutyrate hydrolase family protein [Tannerella sp.]
MKKIFFIVAACLLLMQSLTIEAQSKQSAKALPATAKALSTPAKALPATVNKWKHTVDSAEINMRVNRPLIGLSCGKGGNVTVTYINAVLKAGGIPVLIPVMTDANALRGAVAALDGLLMTGGEDVDPIWFDEEPLPRLGSVDPVRDEFDLKLIRLAADRVIPMLGICRGEQLINVAFGGTLYQDIPSQHRSAVPVKHNQDMPSGFPSHSIKIDSASRLANILGTTETRVNSFHHQAVKDLAPLFHVTAYSSDSVVEAYEAYPHYPILGTQFHPEALVEGGDTVMLKIFKDFVMQASLYRRAKDIHSRILTLDTHADAPLYYNRAGYDFAARRRNRVGLSKMQEGMLDGVFLAAYIGQKGRSDDSLQIAVDKVTGIIEAIHQHIRLNDDLCALATNPDEFAAIKASGKKAVFIGIENGYAIGKDITNLEKYLKMGVMYITLCHSYDNDICDTSTHSNLEWDGLSPFGEEVIREMNRLGIMIDLSHVGESTFWDVMKLTTKPVICSHSSVKALCKSDRNLTDEQLKALAANGGVIQICLLDEFVNDDLKKATLEDALNHIDHAVKVAGIDHVGIGSDFDGGGGIPGCQGANELLQLTVKLLERGYSEPDIAKIWGGNLLRVMSEVR